MRFSVSTDSSVNFSLIWYVSSNMCSAGLREDAGFPRNRRLQFARLIPCQGGEFNGVARGCPIGPFDRRGAESATEKAMHWRDAQYFCDWKGELLDLGFQPLQLNW